MRKLAWILLVIFAKESSAGLLPGRRVGVHARTHSQDEQ